MSIPLTEEQRHELMKFADGQPKSVRDASLAPHKNLIRRNLLARAPVAGAGFYRITEFGSAILNEFSGS